MSDPVEAAPRVEKVLADGRPFGDRRVLVQRLVLRYRCRLRMLAGRSPGAELLLSALDGADADRLSRVLGDPSVRMVLDGGAACDGLDAVLKPAAANAKAPAKIPPLAEGTRDLVLLQEWPWPWIWSQERAEDDTAGAFFQRAFAGRFPWLELSAPSPTTRETLVDGAGLLRALCPALSRSVLGHVHLIAVVKAKGSPGFPGLSHDAFPAMVFLGSAVLRNPWSAAENLLRQAVHVKFIDLKRTHSLLRSGYDASRSPRIPFLWKSAREGANAWPIDRALAIAYIYTCLSVFFIVMTDRGRDLA